eukprot:GFYU01039008.1.p2 GENE.GFYU01039008.1~~GFYU01039008.1.p2  ORF type:complete len:312 (-),score=121.06 GFYU01039008.1:14-949(-)
MARPKVINTDSKTTALMIDVDGTFGAGVHDYTSVPQTVTFPDKPGSTDAVDAMVSQDLLTSVGDVFANAFKTNITFSTKDLPGGESFPIQLTTSGMRFVLPKLYEAYPNRNMSVFVQKIGACNITVDHDAKGVRAACLASIDLNVLADPNAPGTTGDVVVYSMLVSGTSLATTKVNKEAMRLEPELHELHTEFIRTISTVGVISEQDMTDASNLVHKVLVLPLVNKLMARGVAIPDIPGVKFVNPEMAWRAAGYLEFNTNLNLSNFSHVIDLALRKDKNKESAAAPPALRRLRGMTFSNFVLTDDGYDSDV